MTWQVILGIIILLIICGLDAWQNSRNNGNDNNKRGPGGSGRSGGNNGPRRPSGPRVSKMPNGRWQATNSQGTTRSFDSEAEARSWAQ